MPAHAQPAQAHPAQAQLSPLRLSQPRLSQPRFQGSASMPVMVCGLPLEEIGLFMQVTGASRSWMGKKWLSGAGAWSKIA